MAKELFDYSKYSPRDYTYYGFHLKNGRYHIDTRRLIKLGYKNCFPEGLFSAARNTHYFIPKHKSEADYAVNILLEQINILSDDWNNEYKTVINKITTPKEVADETRFQEMSHLLSKDDVDDIDVDALFASIRREKKYNEVIRSIHLQYLQKMFTEFFRAILIVIKDRGYNNSQDFTYKSFFFYVQDRFNSEIKRMNPLYKLPHYQHFSLLNKIDNFLKHNTVMAYQNLANCPFEKDEKTKRFHSEFVFSEKEAGFKYENGMYSGNWLKIGPTFVDEMLVYLREFSKEFCQLMYQEDADEARWNSDDYLIKVLKDNCIDFM